MRIAHIGDIHIEAGRRLEECAAVLDVFIQECRRAQVDLIGMAGDLYHPHSTSTPATPAEELFAIEFLQRCAEIAPVIGVRGNHDVMGDVDVFNHLQARNPIWFAERPHAYKFRTFDVLCLPWFDKVHLLADLPATVDAQETTRRTIEAAQNLLIALKAQAATTKAEGRIPIGLGHLLVYGSEVSTGQRMMGITVELSPDDLRDVGCAYFGLSHVHKRQVWFDGTVAYAGSPMRHNFGEVEAKGFNLVEITVGNDGRHIRAVQVRNDFVELPAKKIELLEADWTDEELLTKLRQHGINDLFALNERDRVNGALVRFRYRIHPKDLGLVNEDAIERILVADGAAEVKIEAVLVHQARIRSEEIVVARNAWDKVLAYWTAKGITMDDAEKAELQFMLAAAEQRHSGMQEFPE